MSRRASPLIALVLALTAGFPGLLFAADAPPPSPVTLEPGFVSTFNGKDLTGWEGMPG